MGFFYPDPDLDPSALSVPILLTVETSKEADDVVSKLLRSHLPHKSIFVRGINPIEVKSLRSGNLYANIARFAAIAGVALCPLMYLFFTWIGIEDMNHRISLSIACTGVGFITSIISGVLSKDEQSPAYSVALVPAEYEIRVKSAHQDEARKILGIPE